MQSAYPTIKPPFLVKNTCYVSAAFIIRVHCREHSPQLPGLFLTSWTWGSLTTPHQALHVLNCQQRTQQIKSLLSSCSSSVMASVSFPVSQSFQELRTSTPGIKFNWNYPKDPTWEEGCRPVLKDSVTEMMILKCITYHQYPDDTNCNLTKHSWVTLVKKCLKKRGNPKEFTSQSYKLQSIIPLTLKSSVATGKIHHF